MCYKDSTGAGRAGGTDRGYREGKNVWTEERGPPAPSSVLRA